MIKGTKIFKVTIENGGIDPKPYNQYSDFEEYTPVSEDKGKFVEKGKALYRWYTLAMKLQKGLDTLSNVKITGGTCKTVPTKVEFRLTYTQPDALYIKDNSEYTPDEVISVWIEEALNQSYEGFINYYYPKVFTKENSNVKINSSYETSEFYGESKGTEIEAIDGAIINVEEVLTEYKEFE